jgi:hypothetical protein
MWNIDGVKRRAASTDSNKVLERQDAEKRGYKANR